MNGDKGRGKMILVLTASNFSAETTSSPCSWQHGLCLACTGDQKAKTQTGKDHVGSALWSLHKATRLTYCYCCKGSPRHTTKTGMEHGVPYTHQLPPDKLDIMVPISQPCFWDYHSVIIMMGRLEVNKCRCLLKVYYTVPVTNHHSRSMQRAFQ